MPGRPEEVKGTYLFGREDEERARSVLPTLKERLRDARRILELARSRRFNRVSPPEQLDAGCRVDVDLEQPRFEHPGLQALQPLHLLADTLAA